MTNLEAYGHASRGFARLPQRITPEFEYRMLLRQVDSIARRIRELAPLIAPEPEPEPPLAVEDAFDRYQAARERKAQADRAVLPMSGLQLVASAPGSLLFKREGL